jgi:hypothetical protein
MTRAALRVSDEFVNRVIAKQIIRSPMRSRIGQITRQFVRGLKAAQRNGTHADSGRASSMIGLASVELRLELEQDPAG